MLKILVDQGYELAQPCPPTLFCLLEFDGVRLATSHNEVRNGKVKFNEEAEFQIKKSGNLRIQLCSVDGKKSVLSLNVGVAWLVADFAIDSLVIILITIWSRNTNYTAVASVWSITTIQTNRKQPNYS